MPASRLFNLEWDGDVLICECHGAVSSLSDVDVGGELAALAEELATRPAAGAVIDLHQASYFGSLLLELLRGLWTRLQAEGRGMALCCVDPVGLDILRLARFDTVWPICPTRDAAIAAVRLGPRAGGADLSH